MLFVEGSASPAPDLKTSISVSSMSEPQRMCYELCSKVLSELEGVMVEKSGISNGTETESNQNESEDHSSNGKEQLVDFS